MSQNLWEEQSMLFQLDSLINWGSIYITAKELASVVELTPRAIQKNIKKLKEQGTIKRVGANKGGYWEVIDESK